jgi:hypothetical protein
VTAGLRRRHLSCEATFVRWPDKVYAAGTYAIRFANDAASAMLQFALHDTGLDVPENRSVVSLHSAELARLYALHR